MAESESVAGPSTWSSNGQVTSSNDVNGDVTTITNGKGKGKAHFSDNRPTRGKKREENVRKRIFDELKEMGYDGGAEGDFWWDDEDETPPAPIVLLPHGIVIDCPPLTTTRSIPHLVAQTLPNHSPHRKRTSSRAYTLPLPAHLASSPYTYGSATLIVRAHTTGRYLLAFFPRLAASTTRRCMTAALSAQRTPADQRGPTNDAVTTLLQVDLEEDLGGCVVLYAKPKATLMTLGVPIYSHAFEVHSWYDVESEPISCLWLYSPRRWIALENGEDQDREVEDTGVTNDESRKTPPKLDRLPPHGPRPPIATTDVSAPTFFLLFVDHRLSLYFPTMNTLAARSVSVEADRSLRVLTSTVLVPNVVTCDQLLGSGMEPKREGRVSIGSDQIRASTSADSKRRRIRQKQATMSLRANDESIWIAFQSNVIDRLGLSSSRSGPTATDDQMALMGMAGMVPGFDQASFSGIPMIQGNQTAQVLFNGIVAAGRTEQVQSVVVEKPKEGEHEMWVNLVEVRVDLLSPTATLQVTPQPRISLPRPTFDPNTAQNKQARYELDGIAFTELKWAEERREVEDGGMDTRDLGLLLIMQKLEGDKRSTCLKVHTLREIRLTLSEALGSLGPGAGGGRKAMQEAEPRFEWLSQGVQEATLGELASTVSTEDATLHHRILLQASSGNLTWLDTQELKLEQHASAFIHENVRNMSLAVGFTDRLVIASRERRSLRVLDLSKGIKDPQMWLRHLAGNCAAALMGDAEDIELAMSLLTRVPGADVDTVIDTIWDCLDMQDSGHVEIEHSDWLLPLLKLQFGLFKHIDDPRQEVAKDFLQLIAVEEAFDLCATPIKIQVANGTNGVKVPQFIPRYYDIDSLWFLIAHLEWYLNFVRLALRDLVIARSEMEGDSTMQSVPHSIITLLHPFGRSLLQSINSHITSFEKFVNSLRRPILLPPQTTVPNRFNMQPMTVDGRDAIATALAKDILQDRLEESGLSIPGLTKALKEVEELAMQKQTGGDVDIDLETKDLAKNWRHTSLLHCRLALTPSLQSVISHLSSTTITLTSQLSLFFSPSSTGLHPIPIIDRDILTKEPLQQTVALGPLRKCTSCGGLSPARAPVMIGGNVRDSGVSRWMMRWSEGCICGGVWTPA